MYNSNLNEGGHETPGLLQADLAENSSPEQNHKGTPTMWHRNEENCVQEEKKTSLCP